MILTTICFFVATITFAGIAYHDLTMFNYPSRVMLAQVFSKCERFENGICIPAYRVANFTNRTVNSNFHSCVVSGTAMIYGWKVSGDVKAPITILFFVPIAVISLPVLVAAVLYFLPVILYKAWDLLVLGAAGLKRKNEWKRETEARAPKVVVYQSTTLPAEHEPVAHDAQPMAVVVATDSPHVMTDAERDAIEI